jgi:hypothetical protein
LLAKSGVEIVRAAERKTLLKIQAQFDAIIAGTGGQGNSHEVL